MSPTLDEQRRDERERARQEREAGLLEAVISDGVLSALGRPGGLLRVQVKRLWAGSYRVNVFVGDDAASARIAHSYFLEADGDGKVLTCAPALTRAY